MFVKCMTCGQTSDEASLTHDKSAIVGSVTFCPMCSTTSNVVSFDGTYLVLEQDENEIKMKNNKLHVLAKKWATEVMDTPSPLILLLIEIRKAIDEGMSKERIERLENLIKYLDTPHHLGGLESTMIMLTKTAFLTEGQEKSLDVAMTMFTVSVKLMTEIMQSQSSPNTILRFSEEIHAELNRAMELI